MPLIELRVGQRPGLHNMESPVFSKFVTSPGDVIARSIRMIRCLTPGARRSEEVVFVWRRSTIGTRIVTNQPASPKLGAPPSAQRFQSQFRV
jgi:hypothetical protein